jgi:hypothetical protein
MMWATSSGGSVALSRRHSEKPDALGGDVGDDALQLTHAMFSPTESCREDPGFDVYARQLAQMDDATLLQEATAFAKAMHGTGLVSPYMPGFIRDFYAANHPSYNGNIPGINPQPAGIAVTDGAPRVYFFNSNNDSGQNWGQEIITSTQGHNELYGEASLPVAEFASRLYVFHYDPLEKSEPDDIPTDDVKQAMHLAQNSWALGR